MPCVKGNRKEVDVALQILEVVTPHLTVSNEANPPVVRETTQIDHLNKRLLATFLEHLNATTSMPPENNLDNSQEFDD